MFKSDEKRAKMTKFLDLNDDCLEHVFDYCNVETIVSASKTCKRLNAMVTHIQFPKQTTFSCTISSYACEEKVCEILDCIGKYLVELKICQTSEIFLFYRFLGRSIGDRIRKLSIVTPHISETSLQAIEPVLWRLEELELRITNTDINDDDLDLQSRCPNLKRLHIQWDTSFIRNTGNWQQLEELSLGDNEYIVDETFTEFMQNNPQLRKLKIAAFNCDVRLEDLANHLANLEQLVLFQNYSDLSADSILELQRLTHLRRLILRNVESDDFEGIVSNATKLSGLVELRIQAQFDQCSDDDIFEPRHQNIIEIALEMPQLQVFGISFAKLKDKTIVEFLRLADNIREIHIHDCDFVLGPENIKAIINARKTVRNRDDPLLIYVDYLTDELTEVSHMLAGEFICRLTLMKLVSSFFTFQMFRKPDISAYLKAIQCRSCEIIPVGFFE